MSASDHISTTTSDLFIDYQIVLGCLPLYCGMGGLFSLCLHTEADSDRLALHVLKHWFYLMSLELKKTGHSCFFFTSSVHDMQNAQKSFFRISCE